MLFEISIMNTKTIYLFLCLFLLSIHSCKNHSSIDRYALVIRHNIENTVIDSLNSLSVGNGGFAFTVDMTGLQTFPDSYVRGIPLGTMSDWGWHTEENRRITRYQNFIKHTMFVADRLIISGN